MERQPTAIIYARVSSAKQAKEELPIESQLEVTMQRARALGAMVLKVFKDEGRSGRTLKRAAFQNAITFCEGNEVDYFITWHSDRFARQHLIDGDLRAKLKRFGTMVVEVADGIDEKSPDAWFYVGLRALINEKRSVDIGRDTKRSLMKNAREGFFNGGVPPFGYRSVPVGRRRRLEVVEDEAVIVRRIFEMCLAGAGGKTIARQLNGEGITKRGCKWSKANVVLLLRNHRYIGVTIFNRMNNHERVEHPRDEWIHTNSHEPIVEEGTFMRIQELITGRAPREGAGSHRSKAVFTGMLRCGHCDAPLMTETATGRSRQYSYYNCSKFLKKGACVGRRIRVDEFDAWLCEQILLKVLTRQEISKIAGQLTIEASKWTSQRAIDAKRLRAEIDTAQLKKSRLFDVLEAQGKAIADLPDIMRRMKEHSSRIEALSLKLAEVERGADPMPQLFDMDQAQDFLRGLVMEGTDAAEKRAFFATFVREVRVMEKSTVVDYYPDKIVNQLGVELVHNKERWLPNLVLLRTAKIEILLPISLCAKVAA